MAALGLLSLGALAIVPILLVLLLAAVSKVLRRSWFGAIAGAGAVLLLVAYLERRGPGTVCWRTATESGCDQYLNPVPWLVAGLVLVAVGVIAQARSMG